MLSLDSLFVVATLVTGSIAKGTTCESNQVVVCKGNGNGGLFSLGNIAPGLLGDNCSGGDVYCCSEEDVEQIGLVNLDLNLQCSLNRVL
ncbi:hypothetical protein N7462_006451 [Penicillium macrosclerotiorum]|uniref:uncharacterized protein n=1 Tax=Penicillium macrosclerotiorum TaxID=303699 RepID=UPI002548044D|nr:uncharacterized protein N7462_006451 [Penicillium macrosclerotiorum]KAJ5683286.1 hypothetical protein N7462_006451 [Penicillium macrosclerotiorum]